MRNTKQNSLVLDVINNAYNHPTAYDVYLECVRVMPNISLGTVYRNLNKLVERRAIQRFELKGKENDIKYLEDNYEELITEVNRIIDIVKKYLEVE